MHAGHVLLVRAHQQPNARMSTKRPILKVGSFGKLSMQLILAALCFVQNSAADDKRSAKTQAACPDISGHYRIAGFGSVLANSLEALRTPLAGSRDSEMRVTGRPETGLSMWVKMDGSSPFPSRPTVVLMHGTDFSCQDGWLIFNRPVAANRKTEQAWLEGKSIVRIAPSYGGGLAIEAVFTGRQRTVIFSYDSARVSFPTPGTKTTLTDAIRWPNIAEPAPTPTINGSPLESPELLKVRKMLNASVLGTVRIAWLRLRGDSVHVTLNARQSKDMTQFEDRLRAASIPYEVKVSPIWTNNQYHFEILVRHTSGE